MVENVMFMNGLETDFSKKSVNIFNIFLFASSLVIVLYEINHTIHST